MSVGQRAVWMGALPRLIMVAGFCSVVAAAIGLAGPGRGLTSAVAGGVPAPLVAQKPVGGSDEQSATKAESSSDAAAAAAVPTEVVFPKDSWTAAGIRMEPAKSAPFVQKIELTGKIMINEESVTHMYPLVEGRVEEVHVRFGQKVKRGDLLLVVQSREVGQLKLKLFQTRLQLDFAKTKDEWIQAVAENTSRLLKLIREGADIEEIEKQLKDRPLGDYREQLLNAYIQNYRTEKHLERLSPLSKDGVVPGRQLLEAESEWKAARATLQSVVEQIQIEAKQSAIVSAQAVKELQTSVAIDETNLRILGFSDGELEQIDPAAQGRTVAHYPIHAPFDGTVISKDAVLMESVGPQRQVLGIADLSSVWVSADIYEEHLSLLPNLDGQEITMQTNAWPGRTFTAKVFYTGDVVDEASRTVSMRALADNAEGLLKPGMFLKVSFPNTAPVNVVQVPDTCVMDHEGVSFVFVHTGGDRFERRDVRAGRRTQKWAEILSGLRAGESVVTRGGFALKSQMLAELLAE